MTTSLALQHISKSFGATVALDDVSFEVVPGEVHALLGENGAGKSTLMHIANGMLRADAGAIVVSRPDGTGVTTNAFTSPRAARAAGLGMVHQHFSSIPALTVAENIALTGGWRETGRAAERRADEVVQRLGLPLTVTEFVEGLSVQLRQRLEIVKALAAGARILLLDEPTAVLAPPEVEELLRFMGTFRSSGGAVVLITHKLDEVVRVADRVTILRHGKVVLTDRVAQQSPQSMSRAMIGGELPRVTASPARHGATLVRVENASFRANDKRGGTQPATFEVRSGEVVGIAAIDGNGQRELLRGIAGVDDILIEGGTLMVVGPVAFVPEDRTTEGLIGAFTLAENLLLGAADRSSQWIDWNDLRRRTNDIVRLHDVRAGGADTVAAMLSGGNQQKFIMARALTLQPRVIVAEDPSRGLDVLAAQTIQQRLRDAARGGGAVLVHSSDLDELLALADRLMVVARGVVSELPITATRQVIGDAMLGLPAAG